MRLQVITAMLLAMRLSYGVGVQAEHVGGGQAADDGGGVSTAANDLCPVMVGEPVKRDIFADHAGRRIYFCCKKCKSRFEAEPERYLENLPTLRTSLSAEAANGGGAPAATQPAAGAGAGQTSATSTAAPQNWAGIPEHLRRRLYDTSDQIVFEIRRELRLKELPTPPVVPDPCGPAFNEIDCFVTAKWKSAGLPEADNPPAVCDDEVFVRRAYLDIIGVIPTIAEAERFCADSAADKRAKLVDALLDRHDDYADHWTPFWEDAIGSSHVLLQGGVPTRGNYRQWIRESFRANKAYDLFAAELIDPAMPGAKKPEIAEANGRKSKVAYIRNETHTDAIQSAAAVAQVFMGTAMKCASCHSHFENEEWTQTRFLAYAGLFAARDLELIRCEKKSGQVAPAKFAFEIAGIPNDVPTDEAGRLRRAAQLLTDPANPRFAKAIVNRLWKRHMGLGLFEPADDFRLNVPPSHPELLEWLAHDLAAHMFDLKHTLRKILTSRTYQLRFDARLQDHFDISQKTAPRYFRSPTLRRLTAEQVIDSIQVAGTQKLDAAGRLYHRTDSTALTRALGRPASRNEISTLRSDDAAVVQALELLNGDEFHASLYACGILAGEADDARTVDKLYRAAMTRPATRDEARLSLRFLSEAAADSGAASHPPATEEIWSDDDTPAGTQRVGEWKWVTSESGPVFSGKKAHIARSDKPTTEHYFIGAGKPLRVDRGDTLFAYVHIDAADRPKEIMLQWNGGSGGGQESWEHRAYWGEDIIAFGHAGTPSRRAMGVLPKFGEWIRLEVPAAAVGFGTSGGRIVGMSFDQAGGTVYWDRAGIAHQPPDPALAARGDLLWALVAGAEFQFIR